MGVWIDTDMGFDDLAAILFVRNAGAAIDGISLVFGNAVLAQVERNAAGAAAAFGLDMPFYRGRALPVLGRLETAAKVLGENGMPSAGAQLPEAPLAFAGEAFDGLCDWLETAPSPRRILALGPLTNIAAMALARPDLMVRIDDLVWMGGGLTFGNHTASAEFNAAADPEALAIVLAHDLPFTMVDLDFCRTVLTGPKDVAKVREAGGTNAALLADLLGGYVDIALSRGRSAMALYDPSAAFAFMCPESVSFAEARIDVELAAGLTRGRTVVETRTTHATFNARYAKACDPSHARTAILEALISEAARR
ncbi:nucleoside hydrolase [Pararhizobium mangrovi]|uniref:Nucleoside hydrolase n=1 Tax=Pararhizobium mangrovi TaxID=2590452 RepID=A0A506UI11_9HYPH|nr:nucleoside hydrolase [Pararhizobium mangrovi]TPW32961.1 nucleoside hydrolase [Pararhizobium mangrovi]